MRHEDRVRLQHMVDAAREAMQSVRGHDCSDLEEDHVWALGLVKCVEIVGEAAACLTKETRDAYPQVPWPQIIAMRNRLVHVYFDIDVGQVWAAVTEDMPTLVAQLERLLEGGAV